MLQRIIWVLIKPKKVTDEDVEKVENEYQQSFEKWLNSSSSDDKAETKSLDKAAKRMNNIKRKHYKWTKYAKWKGIR